MSLLTGQQDQGRGIPSLEPPTSSGVLKGKNNYLCF